MLDILRIIKHTHKHVLLLLFFYFFYFFYFFFSSTISSSSSSSSSIVIIIIIVLMYLNLSKPTQSAAGLKVLKPAANRRHLMCKPLPYYVHFQYRRTLNPHLSKVHAGSFRVSVIHRTLTWTTASLKRARDYVCACVQTREVEHTDSESAQPFGLGKTHNFCPVLLTGFEPRSFGSGVTSRLDWIGLDGIGFYSIPFHYITLHYIR